VRHLAFITPRSLSSAHRDEVSRVSLEWTAVVIASSLIISVVRTWISPGPDYRVDLQVVLIVVLVSLLS
jgi:Na+-translocating ferredoxin:NAD+ oxidoreductase RnfE subunit